jgi:hypothetical protein
VVVAGVVVVVDVVVVVVVVLVVVVVGEHDCGSVVTPSSVMVYPSDQSPCT